MLGVCFESVQQVGLRELSDPVIEQAEDAIVQVELAGLCGSDLHPFFGREVGIDSGTVMGHEFVGTVVDVGSSVRTIALGDRVCAPFTTSCGRCFFCQQGLTSRCRQGQLFGWREKGKGLHGGQAQYVRVPLAGGTLMQVPEGIPAETALLLGDNLSTGHYAADMVGAGSAEVCAVIGCGTVGLLAIVSALRQGAKHVIAIDPNPARAQIARQLGASSFTEVAAAEAAIGDLTDGRGADGVMELVGLPDAQSAAYRLLRPGGTLSVIGCHCTPHFSFSPADAYDKNLTYRTGRCPARFYMSQLADDLVDNLPDLDWCVTHRFAFQDAVAAYDTFAHGKDGCVKAVIEFS